MLAITELAIITTPISNIKKEKVELRITKALLGSSNFSFKKAGVNWCSSQTILKCFPHHAKWHSCSCTVAITQHQCARTVSRSTMMGNRFYSTGIIILRRSKVAICIGIISTETNEINRLCYIKVRVISWKLTKTIIYIYKESIMFAQTYYARFHKSPMLQKKNLLLLALSRSLHFYLLHGKLAYPLHLVKILAVQKSW